MLAGGIAQRAIPVQPVLSVRLQGDGHDGAVHADPKQIAAQIHVLAGVNTIMLATLADQVLALVTQHAASLPVGQAGQTVLECQLALLAVCLCHCGLCPPWWPWNLAMSTTLKRHSRPLAGSGDCRSAITEQRCLLHISTDNRGNRKCSSFVLAVLIAAIIGTLASLRHRCTMQPASHGVGPAGTGRSRIIDSCLNGSGGQGGMQWLLPKSPNGS